MAHHGRKFDAERRRRPAGHGPRRRWRGGRGGWRTALVPGEVRGPVENGEPSGNGPSERQELPAPSAPAAHTVEKRNVATWTCPRAGREPACYVGVRRWREQRQILRGLPHDRVPPPFAGCTVAEQEEGVTGTDFALPHGVTMCGLCRTPVYFEHHYTGRVHTEKAEAAAAGGCGRVRKRGHLSDSRLLGLCRQRCAESPAFAAMLAPVAAPASSSPPRAISPPPVPHQAPPVACFVDDNHTAAAPPPGTPPTPQSPAPRAPPEPIGQPLDAAEPEMVAGPAAPLV